MRLRIVNSEPSDKEKPLEMLDNSMTKIFKLKSQSLLNNSERNGLVNLKG